MRYGFYKKRFYLRSRSSTDPWNVLVSDNAHLLISMPTLNDEVSHLQDNHTPSLVYAPFDHSAIR
jgi:hypothetical protein